MLTNRLNSWADRYSVYIEAQAGFRPNMGTVDNIFVLHGIISHMLNEGKRLYCAFIDFTKAFGYVLLSPCIVQLNQVSNLETS